LFNDGVGIVAFFVLYPLVAGGAGPGPAGVFKLFLTHAAGGAALGAALGWLASLMIDSIEDVLTQSLITIALASGGYALAAALGTSGPIAIVVAGLFVSGRWPETSEAHHVLPVFWDLLDSVLNAVLFVMIGIEVAAVSLRALPLVIGALTVPLALAARWASVEASAAFSLSHHRLRGGVRDILVWGGLRGGVAVALALSLPEGPRKDLWVTAVYVVVTFSILVQGTTIGPLVRRRAL
ncbi:MAG: cation:proton antiporter, partial [Elusimicrobia bacterium]|nr:cation:proton antiporter [Elusimicrobiota bacterium]